MKFNTGRASKQISASEKFQFGQAHYRDLPTAGQKKMWWWLMATCNTNNVDISSLGIGGKMVTRTDYSVKIDKVKRHLIEEGIIEESETDKANKEYVEQKIAQRKAEIEDTEWIKMRDRLPDRKYVKTLDRYGHMYTLEWNEKYKVFVSEYGVPITYKNEKLHKYKKPIAWAYLED